LPAEGAHNLWAAALFDDVCDRVEVLEAVDELFGFEGLEGRAFLRSEKETRKTRAE